MPLESDARSKIRNITSQIDVLLSLETSFSSGEVALRQLRHLIDQFDQRLTTAISNSDSEALRTVCSNLNQKILEYLPILGLILRATNVRNAFEVLEPLQAIATSFLGRKATVILSSEWDYIPFAIPQSLEDLPSITFIGLPASESSNLLVIPLAGHELGHTVWNAKAVSSEMSTTLLIAIEQEYQTNLREYSRIFNYDANDLASRDRFEDHRAESLEYALNQAEEYFCDLFGLSLFGQSYLRAFAYVIAPGIGRGRVPEYPTRTERAATLIKYAAMIPVRVPSTFVADFTIPDAAWSERHRFIVRMADTVAARFTAASWTKINDLIKAAKVKVPNLQEEQRILNDFRLGVPSAAPLTLGDIVNAAWTRADEISAQKIPDREIIDQLSQLNEMALKTVETLEFTHRLGTR